MTRIILILIVAAISVTSLVSSANAAPLGVIGSSRSSGEYAITLASGSKKHPTALYVRGYGRGLSASTVVLCSRGFSAGTKSRTISSMASGRLYRLAMPLRSAESCNVSSTLSGNGAIRLQLLAS
jgi:hypothetical protein